MYTIGRCETSVKSVPFTIPRGGEHTVWTISKGNNRLKLFCNGVQIYDFNFAQSSLEECRDMWSADSVYAKFTDSSGPSNITDTASDFYRPLPNSKYDLQIIPLCL